MIVSDLHVAVGIIAVSLAVGSRCHGRGMQRIAIAEYGTELIGEIADGVIAVDADGKGLVCAESALGIGQAV